jgi:hypothetical protein
MLRWKFRLLRMPSSTAETPQHVKQLDRPDEKPPSSRPSLLAGSSAFSSWEGKFCIDLLLCCNVRRNRDTLLSFNCKKRLLHSSGSHCRSCKHRKIDNLYRRSSPPRAAPKTAAQRLTAFGAKACLRHRIQTAAVFAPAAGRLAARVTTRRRSDSSPRSSALTACAIASTYSHCASVNATAGWPNSAPAFQRSET